MSKILATQSSEAKTAVSALFDKGGPVLIEVRFPGMGTSPDWHLCDDEDQLTAIVEGLGPGAECRLIDVWQIPAYPLQIILRK